LATTFVAGAPYRLAARARNWLAATLTRFATADVDSIGCETADARRNEQEAGGDSKQGLHCLASKQRAHHPELPQLQGVCHQPGSFSDLVSDSNDTPPTCLQFADYRLDSAEHFVEGLLELAVRFGSLMAISICPSRRTLDRFS